MAQPIRVDNCRPATVTETAEVLGVSKKRTAELVRDVRRILHRDIKSGNIVISHRRVERFTGKPISGNAKTKLQKTAKSRAKASR
jgi:serine/threonine protein kinase